MHFVGLCCIIVFNLSISYVASHEILRHLSPNSLNSNTVVTHVVFTGGEGGRIRGDALYLIHLVMCWGTKNNYGWFLFLQQCGTHIVLYDVIKINQM